GRFQIRLLLEFFYPVNRKFSFSGLGALPNVSVTRRGERGPNPKGHQTAFCTAKIKGARDHFAKERLLLLKNLMIGGQYHHGRLGVLLKKSPSREGNCGGRIFSARLEQKLSVRKVGELHFHRSTMILAANHPDILPTGERQEAIGG